MKMLRGILGRFAGFEPGDTSLGSFLLPGLSVSICSLFRFDPIDGERLVSGCGSGADAGAGAGTGAGVVPDLRCSSWSCFSRPSTRFINASRTSVFGPLFFGTASID